MKIPVVLLMSACLTSCSAGGQKYQTEIDASTAEKVNEIIHTRVIPAKHQKHGLMIESVSSAFLGTPYRADTLIGSPNTKEILVADFNGVDCFTLIDYVAALSRASDQKTFQNNLVKTRYVNGHVDYLSRKHFFSDWFATSPRNAVDVTRDVSPHYITVNKTLNSKPGGGEYIPGLGIIPRVIHYIPGNAVNEKVLDKLDAGDFIGIYTPLNGLDVSHVGIVIKQGGKVWFRNASSLSKNMKVVDSLLMEYVSSKPGIVVLREESS
ncbi:DUF1460 domain-containing protein [Hafnia psychrotolerans]|uniref:Membrane protein n=1 Tax=Hafnia psychrotolerans TaxID=1477018 RepID=A0ABQ1G4V8_9GAMM|nr:DUF1460 domain-containing protein [Hafnia psychrotolerans]GGA35555.1 membrane protein [Hafnia psychrotolerans]